MSTSNNARGKSIPLSQDEKNTISALYKTASVLQIAKKINRGCTIIYRFMDEAKLVPLNKSSGSNRHTKDYAKKENWFI